MKANSKTIFNSLLGRKAKFLKTGASRNQTKEKPPLRAEPFSASDGTAWQNLGGLTSVYQKIRSGPAFDKAVG